MTTHNQGLPPNKGKQKKEREPGNEFVSQMDSVLNQYLSCISYEPLVYTTQVNSTFHVR